MALSCCLFVVMGKTRRKDKTAHVRVSPQAYTVLTSKPDSGEAPAAIGTQIDAWMTYFQQKSENDVLLSEHRALAARVVELEGFISAAGLSVPASAPATAEALPSPRTEHPVEYRARLPRYGQAASLITPPSQKASGADKPVGRPTGSFTSASKHARDDGLPDRSSRPTRRLPPFVLTSTLQLQSAFRDVRCQCGGKVFAQIQAVGHSSELVVRCASARVRKRGGCQLNCKTQLGEDPRVNDAVWSTAIPEGKRRKTRPVDDAVVFANTLAFIDSGRYELFLESMGLPGVDERECRRLSAVVWKQGDELFRRHMDAVKELYKVVTGKLTERLVVATDATFDSARGATYAVCPVIDLTLHLVLDLEVVDKRQEACGSDHLEFIGSSRALKRLAAYLKSVDVKLYAVVHDEVRECAHALVFPWFGGGGYSLCAALLTANPFQHKALTAEIERWIAEDDLWADVQHFHDM